jgi:hypothetical protein
MVLLKNFLFMTKKTVMPIITSIPEIVAGKLKDGITEKFTGMKNLITTSGRVRIFRKRDPMLTASRDPVIERSLNQ